MPSIKRHNFASHSQSLVVESLPSFGDDMPPSTPFRPKAAAKVLGELEKAWLPSDQARMLG